MRLPYPIAIANNSALQQRQPLDIDKMQVPRAGIPPAAQQRMEEVADRAVF